MGLEQVRMVREAPQESRPVRPDTAIHPQPCVQPSLAAGTGTGRKRSVVARTIWSVQTALWIWLLFSSWGLSAAGAKETSEYQVKAAYLYQFANFVEWPASSFPKTDSPLVIGVLGDDPFGKTLDETIRDVLVRNRKLVLRRFRKIEDLTPCHILFVSRSEKDKLAQIMAKVQDEPTLTVGEADDFARAGGIINFVLTEGRVKFRINLPAADRAGLKLSAKLLAVAKEVLRRRGSSP